MAMVLAAFAATNLVYHVVRKPTELFFPVSRAFDKMPAETWRQYGALFREHSTRAITPELLAALAQVESNGNPVARTYWRWRLTWSGGSTVLNPGDTAAIPPRLEHSLAPSMTGEASLYRVIATDDPAGLTGRLL